MDQCEHYLRKMSGLHNSSGYCQHLWPARSEYRGEALLVAPVKPTETLKNQDALDHHLVSFLRHTSAFTASFTSSQNEVNLSEWRFERILSRRT